MRVQMKADETIQGQQALADQVSAIVRSALIRVSEHLTVIDVHLSDANNQETGQRAKRCTIEARSEGHQPVAVVHEAANVHQAVGAAADKIARLVESTLAPQKTTEGRRPV